MSEREQEIFLGDAVYASFDGDMIRLRTSGGINQVIYLDPSVMAALIEYAKRVGMVRESAP